MLYDSHHAGIDAGGGDWMPRVEKRPLLSYRIFVTCLSPCAPRVEDLITRPLKARGADVRATCLPVASKGGAAVRMAFAIRGDGAIRGAIAALVNQLSADQGVRAVRWESDPAAV
jgi:hypothetical protein